MFGADILTWLALEVEGAWLLIVSTDMCGAGILTRLGSRGCLIIHRQRWYVWCRYPNWLWKQRVPDYGLSALIRLVQTSQLALEAEGAWLLTVKTWCVWWRHPVWPWKQRVPGYQPSLFKYRHSEFYITFCYSLLSTWGCSSVVKPLPFGSKPYHLRFNFEPNWEPFVSSNIQIQNTQH